MRARIAAFLRRAACFYFGHHYTNYFGGSGNDPYAVIYCRHCGKALL